MRREITLEVDGSVVDLYPDTSLTLNFNSSILGDIGSIKCNVSQTITLPRTITNDRVFDLALLPGYESGKTHRILPCRMYVDGIAIFDDGQCHLLDSAGNEYEIAVTWGVLHQYDQWIKNKPKLRDLTQSDYDYVDWKNTAGVSVWHGGLSQDEQQEGMPSMYYANYDCGVDDKSKINIHPCVTLKEIYVRVLLQNNLSISAPQQILTNMGSKAIVLKNNNLSLNTLDKTAQVKLKPSTIWENNYFDRDKRLYLDLSDSNFFDIDNSSFVQYGYKTVTVRFTTISLNFYYGSVTGTAGLSEFIPAVKNNPSAYAMVFEPLGQSPVVVSPVVENNVLVYNINRTFAFNQYEGDDNNGKQLLKVYVKIRRWDNLPDPVWEKPNTKYYLVGVNHYWNNFSLRDTFRFSNTYGGESLSTVYYSYQENNNGYPMDRFTLSENLPDITQIDFINFICNFYGLFPVQKGSAVELVRFDVLSDNIDNGNFLDWSEKLVETYADAPQTMAFTLGSYARNNAVRYKEDKNDPIDITAYIKVDDESLEWEKKLIEFPFAASHGSKIPQYSLGEDGSVIKNDCEYRLMQIEWDNMTLSFVKSMNPQQIINRNYQTLQDVIRKPKVIEEEMTLSLIDLQELDYTKPVYLAKYGRLFAVMSVQWDSGALTSKVKLLMIR